MIIIDKPYVSAHVVNTIVKNRFPVLRNQVSESLLEEHGELLLSEREAVERFRLNPFEKIYTVSENSIEWVANHLKFTDLPGKIDLFKNKTTFRHLTREMYPGFYYQEVGARELKGIDPAELPFPVVLKPAVGFFSMGVYRIGSEEEWTRVSEKIVSELERFNRIYPDKVLDTGRYIVEEYIEGEEFAFDSYFDHSGEPVILGILKHVFSSIGDMGDRLYMTSREIVLDNLAPFTGFLREVGRLAGLKNFPLHTEVRIGDSGQIVPIEINPLRFGAWCTTADATWFSYGMNPYEYYFSGAEPDWEEILRGREGITYSMIVLDNTTGLRAENILFFDHRKLLENFSSVMEFREIDHKKYNVFGFIYAETRERDLPELNWILHNDLKEFVS